MFSWYNSNYKYNYKTYAIEPDNYCRVAWNNRRSKGRVRSDMDKVLDKDINNFGADVFQILHDGEYEESFDAASWGSPILKEVLDSPEFQILQDTCFGDADFSAFSTGAFLKEVHEDLTKIKLMYASIEDLEHQLADDDSLSDEQRIQIQKQIDSLDFDLEAMSPYIQSNISQAALKALSQIQDVSKLKSRGLLPLPKTDDQDPVSAEKRWDIIEKIQNNQEFRKILELAGRVVSCGDNAITETTDTPDEFVGFTVGNEIDGLQLEDLALLADPDLEDLFWADFADETLLIDNYKGERQLGYGDCILLTDVSPSMQTNLGMIDNAVITRHQMTRAFAYTMHCDVSKDRRIVEIPFTHIAHPQIDDAITSIEKGTSGGTDFYHAFKSAENLVYELSNPDIIFITDGEDHCSTELSNLLDSYIDKGVRIWLYTIGNAHNSLLLSKAHKSFIIGSDIENSITNLVQSMIATK